MDFVVHSMYMCTVKVGCIWLRNTCGCLVIRRGRIHCDSMPAVMCRADTVPRRQRSTKETEPTGRLYCNRHGAVFYSTVTVGVSRTIWIRWIFGYVMRSSCIACDVRMLFKVVVINISGYMSCGYTSRGYLFSQCD